MKVLVTGAAGFIGSHVTDAFLARGDEVVGVDSFTPNYARSLKERNLTAASADSAFRLIETDLAESDLRALLVGSDALVHLAALTNARVDEGLAADYGRINSEMPARLVEAASAVGVASIVVASSSSVYGGSRDDGSPSLESDPMSPIALYGHSKARMEEQLAEVVERTGAPATSLRFFTAYGSRQRPDMFCARAIYAATGGPPLPLLGDGSQRRAWLHVSDAVDAVLAATDTDLVPGCVINVGSPESHSVGELIDLISSLTGSEVELDRRPAHPADPAATIADISLARELLGWQPETSLEEGLAEQIESIRVPDR